MRDDRFTVFRNHESQNLIVVDIDFNEICNYARDIVDESSGVISDDFTDSVASLLKALLCYKKTQYYIHVDSLNNNCPRVSSRRQYLMIQAMKKKYNPDSSVLDDFICRHSQSASLVRLIKEAIKYNPYAKFLRVFDDSQLISLAKGIMQSISAKYEIQDCDIQRCYNYSFPRSNIGSGDRFATSSCMVGKDVGAFYNMFNVKGKLITDRNGAFVGRYLEWKMDNDKTYVDRLYVVGENIQPALAAMDKLYRGRTDVEFYPNCPSGSVKLKEGNTCENFRRYMYLPYIDTFYMFCTKDKDVFLQHGNKKPCDESLTVRSTHYTTDDMFSYECPICHKHFITKAGLRYHRLFEVKSKSGKAFEANKKMKEIVDKYFEEVEG